MSTVLYDTVDGSFLRYGYVKYITPIQSVFFFCMLLYFSSFMMDISHSFVICIDLFCKLIHAGNPSNNPILH